MSSAVTSLGDAAGQPEHRMDRPCPPASVIRSRSLRRMAMTLLPHLKPDLGDDAEHVALGRGRAGPDDEVGSAEEIEVERVVLHHEGAVDQLADLAGGRCGGHLVHGVQGLGGGHVVRRGADAANARGDLRHVFHRPAFGELLESPQLGHLEVGALHLSPASSRKMSILPWPSRRVMGSMVIRLCMRRAFQSTSSFFLRKAKPARL